MKRVLLLVLASFGLVACSGGGGGSGGDSSTAKNAASGVLSLPSATCGTAVCGQSTGGISASAVSDGGSAMTLLELADFAYTYIQSTYIPAVNEMMYSVEQAFKEQGYDQCGGTPTGTAGEPQINAIPDGTYALGTNYSVVVSTSGLHTNPFGMQKKFILSQNGTAFLEVQVGCQDTTERSIYLRTFDGTNAYEAWGHQSSSSKVIYAASDVGAAKRTLYFKSTSASVFQVAAILKDAPVENLGSMTLAMSGGANLGKTTGGLLDVHYVSSGATLAASAAPYSADNPSGLAGDTRHCYTNLNTGDISTTASDCSSLFAMPATAEMRGGSHAASAWNVGGIGSASISTTF